MDLVTSLLHGAIFLSSYFYTLSPATSASLQKMRIKKPEHNPVAITISRTLYASLSMADLLHNPVKQFRRDGVSDSDLAPASPDDSIRMESG